MSVGGSAAQSGGPPAAETQGEADSWLNNVQCTRLDTVQVVFQVQRVSCTSPAFIMLEHVLRAAASDPLWQTT